MKYLISYFRKYGPNNHKRKQYKNIDQACIEEDKILSDSKNITGILIESKKTWRILFRKYKDEE